MRFFLFFLLSLVLGNNLSAQVEARNKQIIDKTQGVKWAKSEVPELANIEVNFRETYSTIILIETTITIDKFSAVDMEKLIQQGRYQLLYEVKDGVIIFSRPTDLEPLYSNGELVKEYIHYNIALPEYIELAH